jgi:hypothetical protein
MDAITDFQRFVGPATFRFVADNADVLKFLLVVAIIAGGWLVTDGFKSPRHLFEKLSTKGTSDGRGDIPREEPKDDDHP